MTPHPIYQPNLADDQPSLSVDFWAMLVLTGLAAGLAGGLLMLLLHAIEHAAFAYSTGTFVDGVRHTSSHRRVAALIAAGLFAAAASLAVIRMQGDTDLNGAVWQRSGRIPILKGSLRAIGSIITVGLGAAVGRENALKQAGAALANIAANWRMLPDDQRRLLVACGGGAGMAAAYNVPMGGALFALEVLLGSFALRAVVPAFTASLLAVWVSWLLLPDQATYTIAAAQATRPLILWAALAGCLCGLVGAAFIRLLGWAKQKKPHGWQVVVFPIVTLAALGMVAVWYPEMLGNGKDVVQLALDNEGTTSVLFVLLILRPLATALILRSGVPGGLFTPTMSLGAVAGSLLGRAWSVLLPQSSAGRMPSCALIGASAMLAATTQGPLSAVVFVLELTRTADSLMVPLLAAVVAATLVTRIFERRSIYSIEVAANPEAGHAAS